MQCDMFPTPHAHPQLQAFEAIESPHALLVHGPAVTAQQDPDAQEPEAWPRVRELADTEAYDVGPVTRSIARPSSTMTPSSGGQPLTTANSPSASRTFRRSACPIRCAQPALAQSI